MINKTTLKFFVLIAIILLLVLSSTILHSKGFKISKMKDWGKYEFAPWVFISAYLVSSFVPLPFAPFVFFAAYIFNPFKAFLYSFIGSMLSIIVMFYLTRWLGRGYIARWEKKHKKFKQLDLKFKENAFIDTLMLRIFFVIPTEFINLLAGLSKIKLKDYFIASVIGTIPVILTSILMFYSFKFKSWILFFISFGLFTLLLLIPILYLIKLKAFSWSKSWRRKSWK